MNTTHILRVGLAILTLSLASTSMAERIATSRSNIKNSSKQEAASAAGPGADSSNAEKVKPTPKSPHRKVKSNVGSN